MVQWLGLHAFTAKGLGSILVQGTKTAQTAWYTQGNNNSNINNNNKFLKLKMTEQKYWHI